jgi:hypothetical protein
MVLKKSTRHLCSELISVVCMNDDDSCSLVHGNLEEISETSAVVLLERVVRLGTKVELVCKTETLKGFVDAYSWDEHIGFFIEIRLDAESRWSPQWFAPEHFLSLDNPVAAEPKVFHPVLYSGTEEIFHATSARA